MSTTKYFLQNIQNFVVMVFCLRTKKDYKKKQIRTKSKKAMFAGIDLHKKFIQIAIMDDTGKISQNDKVDTLASQLSNILQKYQHL